MTDHSPESAGATERALRALACKLGLDLPDGIKGEALFRVIAVEIRARGWPERWKQ